MVSDCALQIVEHRGENNFQVKKEAVKEIYGNERVSNLPVVVLCIAGAARKGKSFMLNFFLDYLIYKENTPTQSCILNDKTRLHGFEFQDGEDRTTLGIWAWSHLFIIENGCGQKVAVSLIDSQGTFDKYTSYEDCSAIFAMTAMFSSVMCFNVFSDLQEDKLNDFTAFIDHGKKIVENIGGTGKLFQSLVFIIRDFRHNQYLNDENGGQKYVENQLGDVGNKKLQKTRDNLKESYERMFGFIFPHPGPKVDRGKTSKISEIDSMFVNKAKNMVETLLSPQNLQTKTLGSAKFLCNDMVDYIPKCVKCFNENKQFAPKDVQTLNREFLINTLEVDRVIKAYESHMDDMFTGVDSGFEPAELVKYHDSYLLKVQYEISKRIKDENIRHEVVERIMKKSQSIFNKFYKQNELLIKEEQKRYDLIKRHEEQVAREKAEAAEKLAAQQREYEAKERQKQAEYEKEKLENDKKYREETERQRKESERKQEEMLSLLAGLRVSNPVVIHSPSPNPYQHLPGNLFLGGYGGYGGMDYYGGSMENSVSGRSSTTSSSVKKILCKDGVTRYKDDDGRWASNPNKKK